MTRSKSNNLPKLEETPHNLTFFLGSPTQILLGAPSSLKPLLPASFAFFLSSFFFIFAIGCHHLTFFFFGAPLLTFICANNHQHLPSCPTLCSHPKTCHHSLPHHQPLKPTHPSHQVQYGPCFVFLFCFVM